MMRVAAVAALASITLLAWSSPVEAHVTECDWVAGHTTMPERQAPGVSPSQIKWKGAIRACERDLAADPKNAHLMYTLGHALYYAHPWQDRKRSIELIKGAAAQGHSQAHFVLGLFYTNGELGEILPQNYCEGAKHHLIAARWGRYASLISYSRNALKGYYDSCDEKVNWNEVTEFLDLARGSSQYDWYDGLLIDDLQEKLSQRQQRR
jgi:TPR repeat protein